MGLFKEFKDDFSQAMNELVPGGDEPKKVKDSVDNLVVDTLGEDVDVKSELSKLDGLLEQVAEKPVIEKKTKKASVFEKPVYEKTAFEKPAYEKSVFEKPVYEKSVFEEPVFEKMITFPMS